MQSALRGPRAAKTVGTRGSARHAAPACRDSSSSFHFGSTLAGAVGLLYPPALTWFVELGLITPGLQLIMWGMGITLKLEDFARVLRRPGPILLGVMLQYSVMPLLGFAMANVFALPNAFAVGLMLVCCCPGGTASNVIAYLARADVALSVSMTAVSTLLAALMTPSLTTFLVGNRLDVDALGLFKSTALVVLVPVLLGLLMRHYLPKLSDRLIPIAPPIAVLMIVLIVGAVLGKQNAAVIAAGPQLLAAIVSTHTLGFALGLALGFLGGQRAVARTISIEVGMQNSGLGAVLARTNFSDPLVVIPSGISAIVHCILGSAVAALWSRTVESQGADGQRSAG